MSKKSLWVVEFIGNDVPSVRTSPDLHEARGLEVIVADTHFVVVSGSHSDVENAIRDYPYWRNNGHPKAGRWIGAGGDETYIDDNCNVVNDGVAVLRSLGVEIDDYTETYADDVLEQMQRQF